MATICNLRFNRDGCGITQKGPFVVVTHCKNCHGGLTSFKLKGFEFFVQAAKSLFMAPQFQFFLWFDPKIQGDIIQNTKGTSLHRTTDFEPSVVQIRHAVRLVRELKKPKN